MLFNNVNCSAGEQVFRLPDGLPQGTYILSLQSCVSAVVKDVVHVNVFAMAAPMQGSPALMQGPPSHQIRQSMQVPHESSPWNAPPMLLAPGAHLGSAEQIADQATSQQSEGQQGVRRGTQGVQQGMQQQGRQPRVQAVSTVSANSNARSQMQQLQQEASAAQQGMRRGSAASRGTVESSGSATWPNN